MCWLPSWISSLVTEFPSLRFISYRLAAADNAVYPHLTSLSKRFLLHAQPEYMSCHHELLFVVVLVCFLDMYRHTRCVRWFHIHLQPMSGWTWCCAGMWVFLYVVWHSMYICFNILHPTSQNPFFFLKNL